LKLGSIMIPASVRFDVFEVFWHFPLVILSALTRQSRHGGLRVGRAFVES